MDQNVPSQCLYGEEDTMQDGGRDFDIEVGYPRRIRRRKSLTG
jgi:hypothetical protein